MSDITRKDNISIKDIFHVNWKAFRVLISMLLANSLSMDWKKNKKKSIINVMLKIITFAACVGLSYVFFYFCKSLNIFSLLPYIPMAVPSAIINVMLIFSFFATLFKVTNELYFANDNKVLLTLPTNGGTLFLARLFVAYINTYIKALTLEIPFLLGYFIVSGYPVYMYLAVFVLFLVVDLAFVLFSAILSIPLYFIKRFFISYPLAQRIFALLFVIVVITGASMLIAIIPEKIDIFTNWSPYFYRIQDGMKWYMNQMSFFYQTSLMFLGGYNGYSFRYFSGIGINGLWTFLSFLASIPILYIVSLSLATPFYLKLASGNDELLPKQSKKEKASYKMNSFLSQLKKELLLFAKDGEIAPAYAGMFVFLPVLLVLISKIFMAMDLNSRGLSLVQVAMLLISLLITLSMNGMIARIYSQEGGAFKVARTYPVKNGLLITSKLVIPAILGTISIIVSFAVIANLRAELFIENLMLGGGILCVYLGHLLYSAALDFTNPKASFGDVSFLSNNENRSLICAFIMSGLLTYLFYLFTQDSAIWINSIQTTSSFKLLLIGVLYLIFNIILYVRKIRYVYAKGESL